MKGLWAFPTHAHFEFNSLAIRERSIRRFNVSHLYIDISAAIIRSDEAETFVLIEPLDRTQCHITGM